MSGLALDGGGDDDRPEAAVAGEAQGAPLVAGGSPIWRGGAPLVIPARAPSAPPFRGGRRR
jgi:hypothetical protein